MIEKILDRRKNSGEEPEFLVKFQGLSHLHNSWQTEQQLSGFRGFKRLQNWKKRWREFEKAKKYMDPEDIEMELVQFEMERESLKHYVVVDRIIAEREAPEGTEEENPQGVEYLVKWSQLGYDQATWESPELISDQSEKIDEFVAHNLAVKNQKGAQRVRYGII